jgi:transcriptional/translational regulatory protein YebC/TACO1
MAEPGSVAWQFSRRGVIYIDGSVSEDDAMAAALEAGADDVARDGDDWRVLTDPSDVWDVKSALEAKGVKVTSAENTMVAANTVPVTDVEDAKKILKIMDGLEDNDDVQDVYANFDMSEEIMQAVN